MRPGDGVGDTRHLSLVDIPDRDRASCRPGGMATTLGSEDSVTPTYFRYWTLRWSTLRALGRFTGRGSKSIREGRFPTDYADTPTLTMCYSQNSRRLLRDKGYILILPIHCPREASRFDG